jgi:predicted PurR-regulated permease PerM
MYTIDMKTHHETTSLIKKVAIIYGVIGLATAGLYLIYLLNAVVLQLVVALLLAVVLNPLVGFFLRRGIRRTLASFFAILIALAGVLIVLGVIVTPLVTEGGRLAMNIPQIASNLTQNPTVANLNARYHIVDRLKQTTEDSATKLAGASVPLLSVFGRLIGGASAIAIIFVFAFFLLIDGPEVWAMVLKAAGDEYAPRLDRIAQKMTKSISGFVTGNLLISLIAGSVGLVTMLILRIPYAFALAALLAVFDLIPLIGAAIATIAIGLVALTKGLLVTAIIVAVLLTYQVVEGHVIQPLVYSRAISLSPLLIVLASVIGAELGGIIGVLLAIPAASVMQIIFEEIVDGGKTARALR